MEVTEVFADDYSSCVSDPDHSYDESRYLLFGISTKGNVRLSQGCVLECATNPLRKSNAES
ncbi:MAG: hypothetical protein NTW85_06935 [Methylococcales bacterium]|nr:hypothetical protein [Methylococcales bacterium]